MDPPNTEMKFQADSNNYVTLSEDGLLTALNTPGNTYLLVTGSLGYPVILQRINIHIRYQIDDIQFTPESIINKWEGKPYSVELRATVLPKQCPVKWQIENSDIAEIHYLSGYNNPIYVYIKKAGKTKITCTAEEFSKEIPVVIEDVTGRTDNYIKEISKEEVISYYEKYIHKYQQLGSSLPFKLNYDGTEDPITRRTTSKGMDMALDIYNYIRLSHGCPEIKWNANATRFAQAGLDYCEKNNVSVSHQAASNSDNKDADKGLRCSNLSIGKGSFAYDKAPRDMFLWFSDISNTIHNNVGHRVNMMSYDLAESGLASNTKGTALYVADYRDLSQRKEWTLFAYPPAGYTPVEFMGDLGSDKALWSLELYPYYTTTNQTKVTIQKDNETPVSLVTGTEDQSKPWLKMGSNSMIFNSAYFLGNGGLSDFAGHSFTFTITGLEGPSSTIQYTTHYFRLADYVKLTRIQSMKIKLNLPNNQIKVGEEVTAEIEIKPAELSDAFSDFEWFNIYPEILQGKQDPNNPKRFTIKGLKKGKTELSLWSYSAQAGDKVEITVIDDTSNEPPASEKDKWEKLTFNKSELQLQIGEQKEIGYTLVPNNIQAQDLVYQVENSNIVKVVRFNSTNDAITVKGLKEGKTTIKLMTPDKKLSSVLVINVVGSSSDPEPETPPDSDQPTNPDSSDQPTTPDDPNPDVSSQPDKGIVIYRLYNKTSFEHLYTSDLNEYNTLPSVGWTQEGAGWTAPSSGDPVYRLYSPVTGAHLYTKDENEVNTLLANGAWVADNNRQPIMYSNGSKSVFRLYNEGIRMHLLTTDENEYNVLGGNGWNKEGVALNALN